jgi:hypothetical protein
MFTRVKERMINKEKKMFTHVKERMIKKDKIKCPPQVMCGGDIKRLLNIILY